MKIVMQARKCLQCKKNTECDTWMEIRLRAKESGVRLHPDTVIMVDTGEEREEAKTKAEMVPTVLAGIISLN